jgi:hypothetical protein
MVLPNGMRELLVPEDRTWESLTGSAEIVTHAVSVWQTAATAAARGILRTDAWRPRRTSRTGPSVTFARSPTCHAPSTSARPFSPTATVSWAPSIPIP